MESRMTGLLCYCRQGFEPELAAELTERAAHAGHPGYARTERNSAFWQRVNQLPVAMLIMETAFSDRESALAQRSLHLSPRTLLAEMQACTAPYCRVYITHTKPAETQVIMQEIHSLLAADPVHKARIDIRWLQAGEEFMV